MVVSPDFREITLGSRAPMRIPPVPSAVPQISLPIERPPNSDRTETFLTLEVTDSQSIIEHELYAFPDALWYNRHIKFIKLCGGVLCDVLSICEMTNVDKLYWWGQRDFPRTANELQTDFPVDEAGGVSNWIQQRLNDGYVAVYPQASNGTNQVALFERLARTVCINKTCHITPVYIPVYIPVRMVQEEPEDVVMAIINDEEG